MLTPNKIKAARRLGYDSLLPKRQWWPRGVALAKIADNIRIRTGAPVRMRNWWRPADYNAQVGGASGSDHILALGIDLDYSSSSHRRIAERFLKEIRRNNPWLRISLGLGNRTTHVGILTKRGARTWHYKSYHR